MLPAARSASARPISRKACAATSAATCSTASGSRSAIASRRSARSSRRRSSEADVHATLGDVLLQMDRRRGCEGGARRGACARRRARRRARLARHARCPGAQVGRVTSALRAGRRLAVGQLPVPLLLRRRAVPDGARNGIARSRLMLAAVERAFRRAIELNPAFADAYAQLAWVVGRAPDRTQDAVELMLQGAEAGAGTRGLSAAVSASCSRTRRTSAAAKRVLTPLVDAGRRRAVSATRRASGSIRSSRYEKERAEWEARARTTIDRPRDPSSAADAPRRGIAEDDAEAARRRNPARLATQAA